MRNLGGNDPALLLALFRERQYNTNEIIFDGSDSSHDTIIHRTPLMMLETLGLLYIESNFQDLRPLETAIWGEKLMQQPETQPLLRLYERYVQEFRQYRKHSDVWTFFGSIPIGEYILLGGLLFAEPGAPLP